MKSLLLVALASFLLAAPAAADTIVHNEAVDGPLSNDPNHATQLVLETGRNILIGQISTATGGDYFTLEVPSSAAMSSIIVDELTSPADFSLVIATSSINWQSRDGFVYFGETDQTFIGLNLLSELAIGPLQPGYYWFGFGPDDGSFHDYRLTMTISMPEPSGLAIFTLATIALGRRIGRRRRSKVRRSGSPT